MKCTKKPWGKEYLLFQNSEVAIWHLFIDSGEETSFHCHPNKKTGLVVLDGAAQVSFLSDHQKLFASDKTMIRHGVFHTTKNPIGYPLELLEIETPVDKADIVRLQDKYGRAGEAYSSDETLTVDPIDIVNGRVQVGTCELYFTDDPLLYYTDYTSLMITRGFIYYNSLLVSGPGDIISSNNLYKMLDNFDSKNLEGILVRSVL